MLHSAIRACTFGGLPIAEPINENIRVDCRSNSISFLTLESIVHFPPNRLSTTKRFCTFFGIWLVVSLISNDTTNWGAIPIGINVRVDRIAYLFLVATFLYRDRRLIPSCRLIPVEWLMLLFFAILLISSAVYGTAFVPSNRYISKLVSFSLVPCSIFMIARRLTFDAPSLRTLWFTLVLIGAYLGFTGLCEHYRYDSLVFPSYIMDFTLGIHQERTRGPFLQAVVMGGALTLCIIWLLWYHFCIKRQFITWIVVPLALGSCYYTNTRAVWLQVAAVVAVFAYLKSPLRKFALIAVTSGVLLFFSGVASKFSAYETTLFSRRNEQIDDRLNIYHASWLMFLEKPLFGFGYGSFEIESFRYFVEMPGVELRGAGEGQHHTILGIMCENGAVGTATFFSIYVCFFAACVRRYRSGLKNSNGDYSLSVAALAILAGNFVSMQFSDFGFYTFLNNLSYWCMGMVYARIDLSGIAPPPYTGDAPAIIDSEALP